MLSIQMKDFENVASEVLTQLATGIDMHGEGTLCSAYIDWGVTGDFYKNCPSKSVADKVARALKNKGYYVYVQRMGYGNRRILEGTPICYRVYKEACKNCNWEEF